MKMVNTCDNIIDDLISYLLDNHKLGQGYVISTKTLQTFLDFKISILII